MDQNRPPLELERKRVFLEMQLGSGNFGEVWKGTLTDDRKSTYVVPTNQARSRAHTHTTTTTTGTTTPTITTPPTPPPKKLTVAQCRQHARITRCAATLAILITVLSTMCALNCYSYRYVRGTTLVRSSSNDSGKIDVAVKTLKNGDNLAGQEVC